MYSVYMHIAPNNKRYIGITSRPVTERFGSNGCLYRNQVFGRAIKKYGWNNIEHIIVADNLTKEDAKQLEMDLIAHYDTTNPKFGYNVTIGGDVPYITGKHHSDETKRKIGIANSGRVLSDQQKKQLSNSIKQLWNNPDYREKQHNKVVSDVARHNMSVSHIGKKHTKEQIEKIRIGNMGKHQSNATKKILSEIVKNQHQKEKSLGIKRNYNNPSDKTKGMKWYNNGVKNIRSRNGCPNGFVSGKLKHSHSIDKKVPTYDDVEEPEVTERKVKEVKQSYNDKADVF